MFRNALSALTILSLSFSKGCDRKPVDVPVNYNFVSEVQENPIERLAGIVGENSRKNFGDYEIEYRVGTRKDLVIRKDRRIIFWDRNLDGFHYNLPHSGNGAVWINEEANEELYFNWARDKDKVAKNQEDYMKIVNFCLEQAEEVVTP